MRPPFIALLKPSQPRIPRACLLFPLAAVLMFCSGCDQEELIDHRYGRSFESSVNGTAVLVELFKQAGHSVHVRGVLRPELQRTAEVIVWIPDDFAPPNAQTQKWLDDWLAAQADRVLIYVGRDFDAEPSYWSAVKARKLSNDPSRVAQELSNAQSRVNGELSSQKLPESTPWYDKNAGTRAAASQPNRINGDWSVGVRAAGCELDLHSHLTTGYRLKPLLTVNGQSLVTKESITAKNWNTQTYSSESCRIVVNNGSFLLNFPLVNKEHRKLAAHLINEVNQTGSNRKVIFLESDYRGPTIHDTDSLDQRPNGWELFQVQPLGMILAHLALIGIMFCFVRWPIFGRPREPQRDSNLDFSKHLAALANLLRRTNNQEYARQRLAQYQAVCREKERSTPPPVVAPGTTGVPPVQ